MKNLDEAAEKHVILYKRFADTSKAFKEGAKWQAERMYSEEEVFKLLCMMPNFFNMTIPEQVKARYSWFEEFKKQ